MISFINGFILPALFAAGIPIILHFLSKKKARKIPFSSLKFLKTIENQRIKRVKLFQILLILVRTLFIVFLVLAFSRPAISTYSGDSSAQTTAVILLDNSYSMQSFAYSKTYFELAKEKVRVLISSFSKDDRVFLYSSALEKPQSINNDNAANLLSGLTAGNSTFNVRQSLQVADSVFRKHLNLNNELYLVSDFKLQQPAVDSVIFNGIRNFRAYSLNIAHNIPFKNVSIDSVFIRNQLFEKNKPFDISVRLSNHKQEELETNLNLFNAENRVSMEFTKLEAGKSKSLDIQYIPKTEGIHFLKLQLEEDDLSFDNTWFLSFYMRDEIKMLFISDNTSYAMRTALKIIEQNTVFKITRVSFNEWPGRNLYNYDLVVLNDPKNINPNARAKFKDYITLGRSIIIIPGLSENMDSYNAFFKSLTDRALFSSLQTSEGQEYYSIENQKTANAIFNSLFRDKKSSFSAPRFYRYFKQKDYLQGLIHFSNKDPFITQSGGLVVFSSALDSDWTDIEINGLFLPLIYRSFYHASQSKKPVSDMHNIGDNIIFTEQGASIDNNYFIQNAAGRTFSVIPQPLHNDLVFDGGRAGESGFYILLNESRPLAVKAINHSSHELKKPYWIPEESNFTAVSLDNNDFLEQLQSARLGFELWLICLICAFLMMIAEMILIKKIEGTPYLRRA